MVCMETQVTGLRERKHAETRSRLEEAAVHLALKDGLEKTTIDAMSVMANVSPRTFFNYFESKEDAILGVYVDEKAHDESIDTLQFSADDDIVESVVELVIRFINPSKDSHKLHKKRRELIRQYPALLEKQITRISKINDVLNAKVKDMIALKHPTLSLEIAETSSEVVVMTCIGGVKIAVKHWLANDDESLSGEVKQRAVAIIKDTIKVL